MNAEFVKALLGAGNEIHAVGLVVNIQERSGLQSQLMIGLLHELKVDLKHILVVFTHGNSILPIPPPTDLRERCKKRCQLVPQHIAGLDCLQSLVANIERRYLVVESLQLSERDIIVEQLFGHIESMAAHPMTNDTFRNSLQWWNELQANREREERELEQAKCKLANLQSEKVKINVRKLRSKHRQLKDECSDLSSKLDKISEMKKILEDVQQVKSDMTECIANIAAVNMKLRTVNEEESVLCKQQSTLKELEYKLMQTFEDLSRNYTDACRDVISHRDEGITIFYKAADEVDALKKKATSAKVSGFSAGIVGGVVFTIGAGLLLGGITAPAAIPLLAIGGAVGAAGSVTAIGGTVGKLVKKKMIIKQTKPWLEGNKNRCRKLIRIHADLIEEHGHIVELFPDLAEPPEGTKQIGEIVNVWKEILEHSAENAALVVVQAASSGLGIAQGVLGGFDATTQLATLAVKASAKAAGGVAVGLSGLVILLDLGLLIKSSIELDKVVRQEKRTNTAQALIDLAEEVQKETDSLRKAIGDTTSEPTDDPTASTISNPSVGNVEQLQDSPTDDLEPNPSNQGESESTSGTHTSSAQVDDIDHNGDDESMISLRTEEGEGSSVCILPQKPTDDPTASVISNPSVGNVEQLQDSPTDDLEPNLNNQGESHSASGTHTSSAQGDEINHNGDDESMISLRTEEEGEGSSICILPQKPTDDPTASVISNPSVVNVEQLQDSPTDDLEPNLNNQGESHSASGTHTSSAQGDEINHNGDDESMISLRTEEEGEGPSVHILPQYTDSSDTSEGSIQEDDRTQMQSASDHSLCDSLSVVSTNDVPKADTSDTGNSYNKYCIIS